MLLKVSCLVIVFLIVDQTFLLILWQNNSRGRGGGVSKTNHMSSRYWRKSTWKKRGNVHSFKLCIFQRLRTENRLLRQRIDYLEQESSALADRLIKGQVNLAQEAENCMSISHELHKLRDINSDAHRRLEEAYDTIRELSCKVNSKNLIKNLKLN